MKRLSMKRMREIADVNATKTTGYATYFPYPETVEKVAYASGVYGWNASLHRGETSGLLYYVSDMGNDCGTNGHALREAFGYREREIVEDLASVEVAETSRDFTTLRFTSDEGKSFEASTFDDGHVWKITN